MLAAVEMFVVPGHVRESPGEDEVRVAAKFATRVVMRFTVRISSSPSSGGSGRETSRRPCWRRSWSMYWNERSSVPWPAAGRFRDCGSIGHVAEPQLARASPGIAARAAKSRTEKLRKFIFDLREGSFVHGRGSPAERGRGQARGGCSGGEEAEKDGVRPGDASSSDMSAGATAAGASARRAGGRPGNAASGRDGGQLFTRIPGPGDSRPWRPFPGSRPWRNRRARPSEPPPRAGPAGRSERSNGASRGR